MAVAAFIVGGILGLIGAGLLMLLTGAGWSTAVMVYFALGYGLPGVVLCGLLIRSGIRALNDAEGSRQSRKVYVSRP